MNFGLDRVLRSNHVSPLLERVLTDKLHAGAHVTLKEGADIGSVSTLLVRKESSSSVLVESAHLEL